jgi:hypothetical protein
MYEILTWLNIVYCENMEKTYVLNATGLGNIWFLAKRFMREEARKRILFPSNLAELDEFISPDQREIKYGGMHPNLTQFW